MEIRTFRFMSAIGVTAALIFNIACTNVDNAGIWKNSDYGTSAPVTPAASSMGIKPGNGFGLIN